MDSMSVEESRSAREQEMVDGDHKPTPATRCRESSLDGENQVQELLEDLGYT